MQIRTLSIIVPCFNEEAFINSVLKKITEAPVPNIQKQIIVVDDGSTDGTFAIIEQFIAKNSGENIMLLKHERNEGKGSCIRSALRHVNGEILVVQDSDLEYDPMEYVKLIGPIASDHADVVYGSRFRGSEPHRVLFFFHTIGNRLLTFWSNIFTGLNLTDMETGFKMFKTSVILSLNLKENRFGFEPEVTAKISRVKKIKIYEVGISYYGRGYEEGKKIKWVDGFRALYCVFKYNIFSKK